MCDGAGRSNDGGRLRTRAQERPGRCPPSTWGLCSSPGTPHPPSRGHSTGQRLPGRLRGWSPRTAEGAAVPDGLPRPRPCPSRTSALLSGRLVGGPECGLRLQNSASIPEHGALCRQQQGAWSREEAASRQICFQIKCYFFPLELSVELTLLLKNHQIPPCLDTDTFPPPRPSASLSHDVSSAEKQRGRQRLTALAWSGGPRPIRRPGDAGLGERPPGVSVGAPSPGLAVALPCQPDPQPALSAPRGLRGYREHDRGMGCRAGVGQPEVRGRRLPQSEGEAGPWALRTEASAPCSWEDGALEEPLRPGLGFTQEQGKARSWDSDLGGCPSSARRPSPVVLASTLPRQDSGRSGPCWTSLPGLVPRVPAPRAVSGLPLCSYSSSTLSWDLPTSPPPAGPPWPAELRGPPSPPSPHSAPSRQVSLAQRQSRLLEERVLLSSTPGTRHSAWCIADAPQTPAEPAPQHLDARACRAWRPAPARGRGGRAVPPLLSAGQG